MFADSVTPEEARTTSKYHLFNDEPSEPSSFNILTNALFSYLLFILTYVLTTLSHPLALPGIRLFLSYHNVDINPRYRQIVLDVVSSGVSLLQAYDVETSADTFWQLSTLFFWSAFWLEDEHAICRFITRLLPILENYLAPLFTCIFQLQHLVASIFLRAIKPIVEAMELRALRQELQDVQRQNGRLGEQIRDLRGELRVANDRGNLGEQEIGNLKALEQQLRWKLEESKKLEADLQSDRQVLQGKVKALSSTPVPTVCKESGYLLSGSSANRRTTIAHDNDLHEARIQIEELEKALGEEFNKARIQIEEHEKAQKEELDKAKTQIQMLEQDIRGVTASRTSALADLEAKQNDFRLLQAHKNALQQEKETHATNHAVVQKENEELSKTIVHLQAENEKLRNDSISTTSRLAAALQQQQLQTEPEPLPPHSVFEDNVDEIRAKIDNVAKTVVNELASGYPDLQTRLLDTYKFVQDSQEPDEAPLVCIAKFFEVFLQAIDSLQRHIHERNETIASHENCLREQDNAIANLQAQVADTSHQQRIDELKQHLVQSGELVSSLQAKIQTHENASKGQLEQLSECHQSIFSLRAENERLENVVKQHQAQLFQKDNTIGALQDQVKLHQAAPSLPQGMGISTNLKGKQRVSIATMQPANKAAHVSAMSNQTIALQQENKKLKDLAQSRMGEIEPLKHDAKMLRRLRVMLKSKALTSRLALEQFCRHFTDVKTPGVEEKTWKQQLSEQIAPIWARKEPDEDQAFAYLEATSLFLEGKVPIIKQWEQSYRAMTPGFNGISLVDPDIDGYDDDGNPIIF